jgi:uncharacterized membrane protein
MEQIEEKKIFLAYEIGLLIKAMQAFLEIIIGIVLFYINANKVISSILTTLHEELTEQPNNIFYNYLMNNTHQISSTGKYFLVFYLLSHGIIKLIIITGLFLKKKWAYPASIVGLGGLILYQIYHIVINRSAVLSVLTVMDIIILWLIYHEHKLKNN